LFLAQATPAPQTPATQPAVSPHAQGGGVGAYVPQRVYDTRRKAFTDFETMLADLARADVVMVGEQHDDPNTHRLESAVLQGLMRRQVPLTVSLEMFERDVQAVLDRYLAGNATEEEFLAASRPWPRYATDYRPLVEMARGHGWRVVASNVPRRLASDVSKGGQAAYDGAKAEDKPWMATTLQCPKDDYFKRFSEQMGSHPAGGADAAKDPAAAAKAAEDQRAMVERFYLSQCLKDETMAESIAQAFAKQEGRPGTIVHYNGAFHSDYGQGTAERVRRRLPGRRVAIVSMMPTDNLDAIDIDDDDLKVGDYLVFTVK
ncbi:MAG TPA: ChaN family lipoprotein, partial [Vicinamibacterales bacterium]